MAFDYEKFIRPGKLPHIWCPGCGHGIVMKGLIRAMDSLNLKRKRPPLFPASAVLPVCPATSTAAPCTLPTVVPLPLPPASKWPGRK